MSDEVKTKVCSKCGVVKVVGEFYKQHKGKYGVTSMCRTCDYLRKKINKTARYIESPWRCYD